MYQTMVFKYALLCEGLADELTQFIDGDEVGVGERVSERKIERIVVHSHSQVVRPPDVSDEKSVRGWRGKRGRNKPFVGPEVQLSNRSKDHS